LRTSRHPSPATSRAGPAPLPTCKESLAEVGPSRRGRLLSTPPPGRLPLGRMATFLTWILPFGGSHLTNLTIPDQGLCWWPVHGPHAFPSHTPPFRRP